MELSVYYLHIFLEFQSSLYLYLYELDFSGESKKYPYYVLFVLITKKQRWSRHSFCGLAEIGQALILENWDN